jgi:hypothetical protein
VRLCHLFPIEQPVTLTPTPKPDICANQKTRKSTRAKQRNASPFWRPTRSATCPTRLATGSHGHITLASHQSHHISRRPVAYLETRSELLTRQLFGLCPPVAPWEKERLAKTGEDWRRLAKTWTAGKWNHPFNWVLKLQGYSLPRQRQPPPPLGPVKPQNPLAAASRPPRGTWKAETCAPKPRRGRQSSTRRTGC